MKHYAVTFLMIVINTLGMLDIWLILKLLFGCDMKVNRKTLIIAASIFVVWDLILSFTLYENRYLTTALIYGYIVVATLILTKSHYIKTVFLTIPAVLVYVQFSSLFDLLEKIPVLGQVGFSYDGKFYTLLYCLADVILFGLLLLINRYTNQRAKSIQLTVGEGIVVTLFCVFSPFISGTLEFFEDYANSGLYNFLWVAFMLLLNVALVYAIFHRKRASYYIGLSEDYKKQFETEYSFFKDYKDQQESTIKFRHDWKNHMLLLKEMLARGEYDKAENYFQKLSETTTTSVWKIATGNEVVDMILSSKMERLEELEVAFRWKGSLTSLSFMEHVDCCILFSNIFDNAIEACANVGTGRMIDMTAKATSQVIYIEIWNTMSGMLQTEGDKIVTTKTDQELHGIGLQNITDIVNKYKGQLQIKREENKFVLQIVFPVYE